MVSERRSNERSISGRDNRGRGRVVPERLAQASAIYPLGRLGEARDIAAAIAFFASPDASWVSGVTLPVDGGRSAVMAAGEAREE